MPNVRWALSALATLSLTACAHSSASEPQAPTLAYQGGQGVEQGGESAASFAETSADGQSGQAAQPGSWTHENAALAADFTPPEAEGGPSYLGGRASQPASWTREACPGDDDKAPKKPSYAALDVRDPSSCVY